MEYKKLGEVFKITSGATPNKTENEFYDNGTIPWVKTGDLKEKDLIKSSEFITELALKKSSVKLFPKNTVLIAMYGATIGATSILRIEATTNQACCAFLPSEEILPEFLYYYFKANKRKIVVLGVGGAQPNISATILKNIKIPMLRLLEQEKIIGVLDKAQELINKRKAQLEALDELIKSQFIEMFGDLYINKKGWNQEKLGELLTIERGGSPRPINEFITDDENGVNWIKIGDTTLDSMYITQTKEKIKPEGVKKSRYVKAGDLLLSNSMSYGRPYILKVDGCIHDGWLVLIDDNNIFNKIYLCMALSSTGTYAQFKNMAVGGVVNNLNKDMVKNLKFSIPPIELQNQFADFVKVIDKLKVEAEKSLKEMEDNFNSLMQKAFKGELFN